MPLFWLKGNLKLGIVVSHRYVEVLYVAVVVDYILLVRVLMYIKTIFSSGHCDFIRPASDQFSNPDIKLIQYKLLAEVLSQICVTHRFGQRFTYFIFRPSQNWIIERLQKEFVEHGIEGRV